MSIEIDRENNSQAPDQMALLRLIWNAKVTQMIYVAAKLGIADLLQNREMSIDDLAESTKTDSQALYRLLRGLASLDIFAEIDDYCFRNTPLSAYLQTNIPESLHAFAILAGEDWYWHPWGELLHCIRTGETAFNNIFKMEIYEYFSRNPEADMIFNHVMTKGAKQIADAISAAYDFTSIDSIIDVGGGHGMLISSILNVNRHLHGILFERPSVLENARNLLEKEGVIDRCELISGNFFESVPVADIYILSRIAHCWGDHHVATILKNCRNMMSTKGRILLLEHIIPTEKDSSYGKIADLTMLVMTGGKKRTKEEFDALLNVSGFKLNRIIPTQSSISIIEGLPQ